MGKLEITMNKAQLFKTRENNNKSKRSMVELVVGN